MSDDEIDITDNPFFEYLSVSNALDQAAKHGYLVAIPMETSLPVSFDRNFALSHIFVKSSRPGVYYTLNKCVVQIQDNEITTIVTSRGFTSVRTSAIICEELHYTKNFESFTVLQITVPLVGQVNPQYYEIIERETLCPIDVLDRNFNQHAEVLMRTIGESGIQYITLHTTEFIKSLTNGYIMVRDYEHLTCEKIHTHSAQLLTQFVDACIGPSEPISTFTRPDQHPMKKKAWCELIFAIDYFIMSKLSGFLLRNLRSLYAEENTKLLHVADSFSRILTSLNGQASSPSAALARPVSPAFHSLGGPGSSIAAAPNLVPFHLVQPRSGLFQTLGIRKEFIPVNFSSAASYFCSVLNAEHVPAVTMLVGLLETQKRVLHCIQDHYHQEQQHQDNIDTSVTAEDMIALFMYLFILCPSPVSYSSSIFISSFRPNPDTALGYKNNTRGLPTNPLSIINISKLESICVSAHAALQTLLQLHRATFPTATAHVAPNHGVEYTSTGMKTDRFNRYPSLRLSSKNSQQPPIVMEPNAISPESLQADSSNIGKTPAAASGIDFSEFPSLLKYQQQQQQQPASSLEHHKLFETDSHNGATNDDDAFFSTILSSEVHRGD